MDLIGTNFDQGIQTMIDRLGAHAVPIQLPIGAESEFSGLIDLVQNKAILYKDELGQDWEISDIPEAHADAAADAREKMLDELSHYFDELTEMIREESDIPADRIKAAI